MSSLSTKSAAARRLLRDVFGFEDFRPGQAEIVDAILAGEDVLAIMPTGSGKSLCFQVPALLEGGLTIVVSPLVALMQDQVTALRLAGVNAATINSGRTREENIAAWRAVRAGEAPILYLSPERLMTERMLDALGPLPLGLVAIDEAHCISQWGPAFRPEYEALCRLKDVFPAVPVAAFTATADALTRDDIEARLFRRPPRRFIAGFDRPNIRLAVEAKRDWKKQLVDYVTARRGQCGIVYCLSRRKTEQAAALLRENGVPALSYHAGMEKEERGRNQDRFLTEPAQVMVATIAFGMGIDKPDVRFVFHTDIPGSIEAYYQEIGRAGRDGAAAEACMLHGLEDIRMRRGFIEEEGGDEARRRREHARLDALIGYCESPACRRRTLLAYFGEATGPCGNCDLCLDPVELADGSAEARLALAVVAGTGARYGAAHVIDILRGSRSAKALAAGHDRLREFGAGADHALPVWRSILRQMVAGGLLRVDIGGHGGLRPTAAGERLRAEGGTFRYRPDIASPRGARHAVPATPSAELDSDDGRLLARLKELRLRLAQARGLPAYMIFSDRTLIDMARRRPESLAEFAEVHGVGKAKLRDLAEPFLDAVRAAP